MHGRQHLDVVHRVEAEPLGDAGLDEHLQRREDLFGFVLLDEEEVCLVTGRREAGHLAAVHPVSVHDDEAPLGLPEDVLEPDHVDGPRLDDVLENAPRPHRWELVDVAHQDELAGWGYGLQEVVGEDGVDHGHLVHDDEVGLQGPLTVTQEAHGLRVELQEPVQGLGLPPGRLRHSLRGPAGGRPEEDAPPFLLQDLDDAVHERGLARARPAGDDEDLARDSATNGLPLLRSERELLLAPRTR